MPSLPALSATASLLLGLLLPPLAFAGETDNPDLEVVFRFSLAPSGLTLAPEGTWVLGVNQAEKPRLRAVRISKAGEVTPFPTEKMSLSDASDTLPLDAVESLQADADGVVWILDNGRRSEVPPKVVGWNDEDHHVQQVLYLSPPAITPGSFLSDLVVDSESPLVIISDPANGPNAALIVLDRSTGIARRVLQGHPSVVPDPTVTLATTRTGQQIKRLDGTTAVPHCGVRSLAMDRKAQWLYFAPVQSRAVFRLPLELLRNPKTPEAKLVAAVERYASKPAAASLTIDSKNNLYIGDIEGRGIGVIEADKKEYRILTSDARLLWPDGLCFGQDGKLYFFSRAHTSTPAARGNSATATVHNMFRTKALAAGVPGS